MKRMPLSVARSAMYAMFVAIGLSSTLEAQSGVPDFTEVTEVECRFAVMTTGTWEKGEPMAEIGKSSLALSFTAVNASDGTAEIVDAALTSDIIVRVSGRTLHFLQSFREGPLYATTVFPRVTRDGRLQAVHTRHEYTEIRLPGFTSRPEQYYGDCEVR